MSKINLPEIVQEWMIDQGTDYGSPRFSALKLYLSNVSWQGQMWRSTGNTRSFEMENASPASGIGHLQTVKEGRPVTTVIINSGVIIGYPKWTVLALPREIHSQVGKGANVEIGRNTTQRIETSMLQVDAEVGLQSRETKYATVENADIVYKGSFTGQATLSGKVLFENTGQIPVVQIFKDMSGRAPVHIDFLGRKVTWPVNGRLEVNFEDNQKLLLQ